MSTQQRPLKNRLIRYSDSFFDVLGLRPLGIVVFASSSLLFLYVIGLSAGATRADGVAVASLVDHPSLVSSFTTQIFVKPGDRVEVGAPLVELSSHFVDQNLARIELEMEQIVNESNLREAELSRVKSRASARASAEAEGSVVVDRLTAAHYENRIAVMEMRRAQLLEERDALVVTANSSGIVSNVARLGASIAEGASVASLMPAFAEEIVAYVSPTIDPSRIQSGVSTFLVGTQTAECRAPGRVRNRGARVEQAPKQLNQFMGVAIHGMPVHVTIPPDCRLINGQVLALNFRNTVI